MKALSLVILGLVFSSLQVRAEEVSVNVDKVHANQDTTITVSKGDKANSKKRYELSTGEEDLAGDKDVVAKNAELNWKKACTEWKAEFKENNKDNKIISMSCGRMKCEKEGVETTCKSNAKYKVRVLVQE